MGEQEEHELSPKRNRSRKVILLAQLKLWLLILLVALSFFVRLFSIIRYESTIHEFDPFFQYRATSYMVNNGFKAFLRWFDDTVWYPVGRLINPTTYPGLMIIITTIKRITEVIGMKIDTKTLCVYAGPAFSILSTIASYVLGKMAMDEVAGIASAFFVSICSGYLQRSVAGAYDNESVCIALLLLFTILFLKRNRFAPAVYLLLALSWGGFIFVTNLVPLYELAIIILGMYDIDDICYYITFSISAIALETTVPMVGPRGLLRADHVLMFGVLGLCILILLLKNNKYLVSVGWKKKGVIFGLFGIIIIILALTLEKFGVVSAWVGRFATLINPTSKSKSQIVSSVAEHQPSNPSLFIFTFDSVTFLVIPGVYQLVRKGVKKEGVFLILFLLTTLYFSASMVRIIVVLSTIICVIAGIGVALIIKQLIVKNIGVEILKVMRKDNDEREQDQLDPRREIQEDDMLERQQKEETSKPYEDQRKNGKASSRLKIFAEAKLNFSLTLKCVSSVIWLLVLSIILYKWYSVSFHSAEFVFSNPTVILGAQKKKAVANKNYNPKRITVNGTIEINYNDPNLVIVDDYREAYSYLRENAKGARIASWWDYGYQLTEMTELITFNDNNTVDEKKIAKIGEILISDEKKAFELMNQIKADYLMVSYGGNVGISGDDINKMLWIIRIVQEELGVVDMNDYLNKNGSYLVTSSGSRKLHESMIYKMCYYDIDDITSGKKYDIARRTTIDTPPVTFKYFEEVFSSSSLLVRVFRPRRLVEW